MIQFNIYNSEKIVMWKDEIIKLYNSNKPWKYYIEYLLQCEKNFDNIDEKMEIYKNTFIVDKKKSGKGVNISMLPSHANKIKDLRHELDKLCHIKSFKYNIYIYLVEIEKLVRQDNPTDCMKIFKSLKYLDNNRKRKRTKI